MHTNPNGGTRTFTGVIGGGGGGLMGFILNGSGTQVLSNLNTYAGVTDIRNGSLSINTIKNVGVNSAIGAPALAQATILFGNTTATGTLVYTGIGDDTNRVVNLNGTTGGGTITQSGASGMLRFNATAFTATGVGSKTLTLNGSTAGTGEIAAQIVDNLTGTNLTSVTKSGTGTWVLSGSNTYTGGTALSAGMLQFTKLLAMPATGAVALTGGTLAVNVGGAGEWTTGTSGNGTIGGLLANLGGQAGGTVSYTGTVALGFDTSSNGNQTYAGAIPNVGTTLGITKLGTNTLALSNSANTYTGATTISAGTLQLTGSGRLNSGNYSGAVALSNSAVFDKSSTGTQIMSGNITGATGTVKLDNANGELLLRGSGNSYGTLNINAGRLFIQTNAAALPAAATVSLTGGTLDFDLGTSNTFNNSITVSSGANIAARSATTLSNVDLPGTGTVIFNSDDAVTNTLSIGGNQTLTGPLTVQVGNVGGGGNATVGAVTLAGEISGGFGLTKTQIGTLTLSGVSTYTGDTLINNGTLALTSTGGLKFVIGASGTNNKISGTGSGAVSLDGMFTFDLTSAGTTVNDMWNIVDIANLNESYGSNFGVVGFSDIGGGLWSKDNGGTIYQFSTGSGVLTVIPEPNAAALLGALGMLVLLRRHRA